MWQETLNKIQTADAVLVILEPYREIINPEKYNLIFFLFSSVLLKTFAENRISVNFEDGKYEHPLIDIV